MGAPAVELFASTTGTDSDWVVKLIDVYPNDVPEGAALGLETYGGWLSNCRSASRFFAGAILRASPSQRRSRPGEVER